MSKKESVLFNFTPDSQLKISEGDIAFTLLSRDYKDNQCLVIGEKDANTIQKTSHPKTTDLAQGWEYAKVNDTLNVFDNGEVRTPTLICSIFDARGNGDGNISCTITGGGIKIVLQIIHL